MKEYTFHELVNLTMTGEERFCLASEVDAVLKRQAAAAIAGMNAAKAVSSAQVQQAYRLNRESSPEALESERAANAILTAENDRLRKVLATVPVIAGLVHKLWDSDQDSKVGKWLIALAGGCPGYTALTDELHAAITTAPQYDPPATSSGTQPRAEHG